MTTKTETQPLDNPRFFFSGGGGVSSDILLPDNLSAVPSDVRLAMIATGQGS
jgi:hypothetical protein